MGAPRIFDPPYSCGTPCHLARGRSQAEADIELLPFGDVGLRRGDGVSRRGQMELNLNENCARAPELFEAARLAEVEGELEASARLYEAVLRIHEHDAHSAFNLGNVLEAKGEIAHAKIAYLRAIQADPSFSDAWCNLGVLAEEERRALDAEQFYRSALQYDERHTSVLWNLARLLCDQERFCEALPLWEKLSDLSAEDRTEALKWSKVCRLEAARLSRSP